MTKKQVDRESSQKIDRELVARFKSVVRTTNLRMRKLLPEAVVQKKSAALVSNLLNSCLFVEGRNVTVLGFSAINNEPDVSAIAKQSSINYLLPRIEVEERHFTSRQLDGELEPGPFGILQPQSDAGIVEPDQVQVVLVPCVAFDPQGVRVGYGGGYYDTMLPHFQRATWVGVGFQMAAVAEVPSAEHDRKLDALVTESEFRMLKSTSR